MLMSVNSILLMKLIGSMVIIAIAPLLLGFQPAEGLMNVKITTATHIPGPPSYSCPNGVKVHTISINFTASRIANNTGGAWDIMAPGPAFKNGTIQNVTISKNNYYILGREIADNICKDSVPVYIIIYGQCNLNRTVNYSESNAEKISFGPSTLRTHCLFGPLISHNPSLLYNCPHNILNCLELRSAPGPTYVAKHP
jgi:hypothetical protein